LLETGRHTYRKIKINRLGLLTWLASSRGPGWGTLPRKIQNTKFCRFDYTHGGAGLAARAVNTALALKKRKGGGRPLGTEALVFEGSRFFFF